MLEINRNKKINLITAVLVLLITAVVAVIASTNAKYVTQVTISGNLDMIDFYFDANATTSEYTIAPSDTNISVDVNVRNYIGEDYTSYNVLYYNMRSSNNKFTLSDSYAKIDPGSAKEQTRTMTISFNTNDLDVLETFNIIVYSTDPYEKEIEIPITVHLDESSLGNYKVVTGSTIQYTSTLANAISLASSGSKIVLLNSITDTSTATISKNLTLDTGISTLTRDTATITVSSGYTLNIKGDGQINTTTADVITNSGSVIVGESDEDTLLLKSTSNGVVNGNGTLTVNGGTIEGSESVIYSSTGTITINGGIVNSTAYGITATSTGYIYVNGGTVIGSNYAINASSSGYVYIGNKNDGYNVNSPIVSGGNYGVYTGSTSNNFYYYSGTIKGKNSTPYYGNMISIGTTITTLEAETNLYCTRYEKAYYSVGTGENLKYAINLEHAIGIAQPGDTITLLDDVTDTSTATISKNIIINTDTYTLTRNTSTITINSGYTLDIVGNGTIRAVDAYAVTNAGTLNIGTQNGDNVALISDETYGVNNTGRINVNSGSITGTYGIYTTAGTTTINGGIVTGNSYGINTTSGEVIVNGGIITATNTTAYGIYTSTGTITVNGGEITLTSPTSYGIYATSSAYIYVNKGIIEAKTYGIYGYSSGYVNIGNYNDGYDENSPIVSGGTYGVYMRSSSDTFYFYGGTIKGTNSTPYYGSITTIGTIKTTLDVNESLYCTTYAGAYYSVGTGENVKYAVSLSHAIGIAQSDDMITVLDNLEDTSIAAIDKNITINTNGHTLNRNNSVITVNSGYELNVTGTGTISGTSTNIIENSGILNVTDATIQSASEEKDIIISSITNNGSYYFTKSGTTLVPNNSGVHNTSANSYIKIDLSNVSGTIPLVLNATISSESGYDYGYAGVTTNTSALSYSSSGLLASVAGSGTNSYYTTLTGGNIYYLHIGYRKDGSANGGNDAFTINYINIDGNNIDYGGIIDKAVIKNIGTGSVNVNSGTISGTTYGIKTDTGTVTVNGGTISGLNSGIQQTGSANIYAYGGVITGESYGICAKYAGNGTIFVGNNANEYNANSVIVSGGDYGIYKTSQSYTFEFNNGTIKGKSSWPYFGTINKAVKISQEEEYYYATLGNVYSITTEGDTVYYNRLYDAIEAANGGDIIELLDSTIDVSTAIIDKNITIDTNTNTLTRNSTITVNSGYTLKLLGTGGIVTTSGYTVTNSGVLIVGDTVEDTLLLKSTSSYAINGSGSVTVNGGNIQGTYGIYGSTGITTINGGSITASGSYGIYTTSGKITINGGNITANSYGIYQASNAYIYINGGTITGTTYGIYAAYSASGYIYIGNYNNGFDKNSPIVSGGTYGIYKTSSSYTFYFYGGTIKGTNSTPYYGNITTIGTTSTTLESATNLYCTTYNGPYFSVGNGENIKYAINLAHAIGIAQTDDTVTLLANTTDTTSGSISKNLTIDTGEYTLTRSSNSISVASGYIVNIVGSGTITSTATYVISNSGTLKIGETDGQDIKIRGTGSYGINNSGTLIVDSGTVTGVSRGIDITAGTTTINGGTVTTSATSSYAIYTTEGAVIVNGGNISTTTTSSVGIYTSTGTVTVNGGIVTGAAYGIHQYSSANIYAYGGAINGNTYGIYAQYGTSGYINIGNGENTYDASSVIVSGGSYGVYKTSSTHTINFGNGTIRGTQQIPFYGVIDKAISVNYEDSYYNATITENAYLVRPGENGVYANTLNSAISLAQSGDTIRVIKNVTDTTTATIDRNITLDTNEFTITREKTINVSSVYTLNIIGNGAINTVNTYVITNEGTLNVGTQTGDNVALISDGTYGINNTGTLNVNSGSVTGTYGIYTTAGTTTINGGTVTGNSRGIYTTSGAVIVNDGTVTATSSTSYGIYTSSGAVTTNGGIITATGTTSYGIYSSSSAYIYANKGNIKGNTYGIYGYSSGYVYIGNYNAGYDENSPIVSGGQYGVYMRSSSYTFYFYGGTIKGTNSTPYYGSISTIGTIKTTLDVNTSLYCTTYAGAYYSVGTEENVKYAVSLSHAIGIAESGNTIKLLSNVTDSTSGSISKNLTIDTNTFTLTRGSTTITVNSGYTVNIIGNGQINSTSSYVITNSGTLVVGTGNGDTVALRASSTYGINNTGTLTVDSGTVSGSSRGINTTSGTTTINGGTVTTISTSSYAIYTSSAPVIVNGGTVSATNSSSIGIYTGSGTVTVNGGIVTGAAYGIQQNSSANIYAYGGTITGNSYGIYAQYATSGYIFVGNSANEYDEDSVIVSGGSYGVYKPDQSYTFTFSNGTIKGTNSLAYYGTINKSVNITSENSYYCARLVQAYSITRGESTTYYYSLNEAITAAQTGETIELLADVTDVSSATISKNITIDTNTYILKRKVTTITVSSGYTLNILGNGEIYTDTSSAYVITNSGNLVVGNTVEDTVLLKAGATHAINGAGSVTVNGGNIQGQDGIHGSSGTITINGGTITATSSYGIYTSTGTVTVNGGTITSASYGIYSSSSAYIYVNGGTVIGSSYGINYRYQASSRVTIGSMNKEYNEDSPIVSGGSYGVYLYGGYSFSFYNGTVRGTNSTPYYGSYSANGSASITNISGYYCLRLATNFIVQTGDETRYATTLNHATTIAQNGDIIKPKSNVSDSTSVTITKNVTLDTDGYRITRSSSTITVNSGATLNVIGNGNIYSTTTAITNNGTVNVLNDSERNELSLSSNSSSYYFTDTKAGGLVPNIANSSTSGVTASSYMKIDLTGVTGTKKLVVNAEVMNSGYAYATITNTTSTPSYSSSTGRFMYVTSTSTMADYSTTLTGGSVYYLHLGYYKSSSSTGRYVRFNTIKLDDTILYGTNFSVIGTTAIANNTSSAVTNIKNAGVRGTSTYALYGTTTFNIGDNEKLVTDSSTKVLGTTYGIQMSSSSYAFNIYSGYIGGSNSTPYYGVLSTTTGTLYSTEYLVNIYNTRLRYDVPIISHTILNEEWTNQSVGVQLTIPISYSDLGFSIKYKIMDINKENLINDWADFSGNYFKVTTNCTVVCKAVKGVIESEETDILITNIDRIAPPVYTPVATSDNITTITIDATTTDAEATTEYGCSGIALYYYSDDGGATWIQSTSPTKEYEGIVANTDYTFDVKVADAAGNITRANSVTTRISNVEPVITSTTYGDRETDSVQIVALATDEDNDELIYSLYIEGELKDTQTAAAGTATTLTATDLTMYTIYNYYVVVSDRKSSVQSETSTVSTACEELIACEASSCTGVRTYTCNCSLCTSGGSYTCSNQTLTCSNSTQYQCGTYRIVSTRFRCEGSVCEEVMLSGFYVSTYTYTGSCGYTHVWRWWNADCSNCGKRQWWGDLSTISSRTEPHYKYKCPTHNYIYGETAGTHTYCSHGYTSSHTVRYYCSHGYSYSHYYCSTHGMNYCSSSTHTYSTGCEHGYTSPHYYCIEHSWYGLEAVHYYHILCEHGLLDKHYPDE